MLSLRKKFEALPLPKNSNEGFYSAESIEKYPNHHVAKNHLNQPCLLIFISELEEDFFIQNQRLYNLKIAHNIECEIEKEGKVECNRYSVITCLGYDIEVKVTFLSVCEVLLNSLGVTPSNRTIKHTIEKLVELFKALRDIPKKSLQGLWAELFIINQSSLPEKMIGAWHSIPEERFDFSFDKLFLEIKSSSNNLRKHHFSMAQLSPKSSNKIIIASLFVVPQSGGVTLGELLETILKRLSRYPKQKEKLLLLVSSTLGTEIAKINDLEIDYNWANESLKFFDANEIPSISLNSIPKEVSNVKFISNLENVKAINYQIDDLLRDRWSGI